MNRFFVLSFAIAALLAGAGRAKADPPPVRVVVWDEQQPAQKEAYENFLGNAIAAYLKQQPGLDVRSVKQNDPDLGLAAETLDFAQVLVWWGHVRQQEIPAAKARDIVTRIKSGRLALVALHSAHWSAPFVEAMNERTRDDARRRYPDPDNGPKVEFEFVPAPRGVVPTRDSLVTPAFYALKRGASVARVRVDLPNCVFPEYRADGKPSHVTVLLPEHPLARDLPKTFDIPHTEMYNEPFHVPEPDEVVFEERWDGGERFRSGCVWRLGAGRVFYFRPGHETFPVYRQPETLKVIENAVRWLGTAEAHSAAPVRYDDHLDLIYGLDGQRERRPIRTIAEWETRRRHVLANLQEVMGPLPGEEFRVPLDARTIEEQRVGTLVRKKVIYRSDPNDSVPAWLFVPDHAAGARLPAVLCLHQTTSIGKDEPAGLGGSDELHYALQLAQRGYVTLAPDYPSFGEHAYDFDARRGYVSGSMKAIWDNLRAVDLLMSLDEVDGDRIGCVGHSLGGHSAIFTAVFDTRLKAVVSSCGFTRLARDDVPSWTGRTYMPRIATLFSNDAARMPFDFPELIAAIAPRAFFASAATRDDDFDVTGVRESIDAAGRIYDLWGARSRLRAGYPDAGHSFPEAARKAAWEFLDRNLKP